jgi:hypothetical protein
MYAGVPRRVPVIVMSKFSDGACWRAMPKSRTLTRSTWRSGRNRFDGLMSRWTMPRACAKPSASATRVASVMLSRAVRPPWMSRSARSSPSSHSMAR